MDDNLITLDCDEIFEDMISDSEEDILEETEYVMNFRPTLMMMKRGLAMVPELADEEMGEAMAGCSGFSKPWKHKEDMTIQDVLKKQVLCFLPAKVLCRFKKVCREWNHWIAGPFLPHLQSHSFHEISGLFCQKPFSTPFFISLNHMAYGVPNPSLSFLPEEVTVNAACNGLLCCKSRFELETKYYICNPANKEWILLPKPRYYHGPNSAVALAFEPDVLNFKEHFEVVCAVPLPGIPVIYFEIYSSRSNTWRLAEAECWEPDALDLNVNGFYLNGVAFWETSSGAILAFHVRNEQYGTLPLPQRQGSKGALTARRGELCYILPYTENNELIMEIYGDMKMTLKYKIHLSPEACSKVDGELRALPCVNDDLLMLGVGNELCAYHVKEGKLEILSNIVTQEVTFLPYVNSLVPVGQQLVGGDEYRYY